MTQQTSHDVIELIRPEHKALHHKLRQIDSVLADREVDAEEIHNLLQEFREALMVHFSNEEEEQGFFESVTAHAPQLSHQAGRLCVEHRQLSQMAAELRQFAAAGCPSMPWWRELKTRCLAFSRQLMKHENDESSLLHRAYQEDFSGGRD